MDDFSSANLIFLISQPRSGSTLLQRVLAGHPSIHTTAEPWLMLHPIYALRSEGYQAEYNAQLAQEALVDFYSALDGGENIYLEAIRRMSLYLYETACRQAGKQLFLDKTPRYYLIVPELVRLFPQARFILLLRNPLAVLESLLRRHVQGYWPILVHYRNDLLVAPRLLNAASKQVDAQVTVVRYEELVEDPQARVTRLCSWLNLNYNPAMLNYGQRNQPVGNMGDTESVQHYAAPTKARLAQWRHLGREPQTRHFAEQYLHALGHNLLADLGYDYATLQAQLLAEPCGRGEVTVTWDSLFYADDDSKKRLVYSELALLLYRRAAFRLRKWRE